MSLLEEKILNLEKKTELMQRGINASAYLILGAQGVGKLDFAIFCASLILCKNKTTPCLLSKSALPCPSCKKIIHSAHPDIHFYGVPEAKSLFLEEKGSKRTVKKEAKKETLKAVTVGEVRELIAASLMLPGDGDKQIFIINGAQKMRREAQNALLKVLEEPPASTVIFMLSEKREALLPTVLSRCTQIELGGESDEVVREHLRAAFPALDEETLSAAVRFCEGSIGSAIDFLDKEATEVRQSAFALASVLFSGKNAATIGLFDEFLLKKQQREHLIRQLKILKELLCDVIKSSYTASKSLLLDEKTAKRYASKTTPQALNQAIEKIEKTIFALEGNSNTTAEAVNLTNSLIKAFYL